MKPAKTVRNEDVPEYMVTPKQCSMLRSSDDRIVAQAMEILASRMRTPGEALNSPNTVRDYLKLKFSGLEHEEFHCTWLDTQHRVIAHEMMFTGTLSQTSVYPREVVKRALAHNASAVIFSHNHPSGVAEPSQSDRMLTGTLKQALALVDVRALDHIIVAGNGSISFAERGEI